MTRTSAWFVHIATALVGVTGLVYGWMRYLLDPADEFALVNHPREPLLKTLHILTAPLLVFACGLLWRHHIWARIRAGYPHRRRSGMPLAALLIPMVASGYLLQTAVDPGWRQVWIWIHGVTASLWVALYLGHHLWGRDGAENQSPGSEGG